MNRVADFLVIYKVILKVTAVDLAFVVFSQPLIKAVQSCDRLRSRQQWKDAQWRGGWSMMRVDYMLMIKSLNPSNFPCLGSHHLLAEGGGEGGDRRRDLIDS